MEKIIIYSPVDGEIKPIEKISDPVFAEKMLGDGFYIDPKSRKFFSPFVKGEIVNIFDTKHAIHIKADQGPTILMHLGLETVNLAGQPFDMKVKTGQKINLKTEIVEVDWSIIKKQKLSTSTPIVIDANDNPGWTIQDIKYGLVKQGEPIATLRYEQPEVKNETFKSKPINLKEALKNGIRFTNRYEDIAGKIYDQVGGKNNYSRYYNCVTRLRFVVKDKALVDEAAIKKFDIVKGINWNKNELQVIIGGEVEKVKDGLDNYLIHQQQAQDFDLKNPNAEMQSFGKKLLNLIKGIIMPAIPILIGVGLINAVQAVLQQAGAIQNVSPSAAFGSYTLATQLIYLIAGGATLFMGIFFTYNGVKFFGGNPLIGIVMGLILTAPVLFKGDLSYNSSTGTMLATPWSLPLITSKIDGVDFVWMKIGPSPGSMITATIIAYITVQAEKFAKKRFPNWSLMLTVSTFTIFVASVLAFFVVGPIISVLESGLGYIFSWINKIPYGISIGLFAFMWQPLVITGAHGALATILGMPIQLDPDPYIQGLKTIDIMAGITIGVLGQVGASIGFLFITKNATIKQILYAGIPAGFFGITEPLIFGVNLPKVKPFLYACTGAGVGGVVAGLMGAKYYSVNTGMGGLFSVLNANGPNGDTKSLIATLVGFVIAVGLPILLVIFFAKERTSEKFGVQQASKSLNRFLNNKNVEMNASLQQEVDELKTFYSNKEVTDKIKLFEKNMAKIQTLQNKISALESKDLERKETLAKHFSRQQSKLKEQKNVDQIMAKLDKLVNQINIPKHDAKIAELEKLLKQAHENNAPIEAEVEKLTQDSIVKAKKIGDKLHKLTNSELSEKVVNRFYNAINSVYINYGFTSKKDMKFSKLEKQELKGAK
ncbi:glucose PTS transporter subunit IIA [Williamsoniiplasma luminosum]|uniref:Uncharacterized protein n=1 Tax=Williamsoniiplasma luminosum TaxID=214888 RepID=A0A2S0NK37_9MOLU|nr:glucose PTS transporter subunit IIA [Williamsoniiplasma luminosum]AVP49371.1 MAG: hypothetical protein C5T88_02115 [Williamsoniiplasma luminosum]